jgi:hypothetical protein
VKTYAELHGYVAGEQADGFFLGSPAGDITMFADRESWLAACRTVVPGFDGVCNSPSRFDNPVILGVYLVCGAVVVTWLALLVRGSMRKER